MNSLQEISARLRDAKSILVTSHIMPDGDSIGSLLGFGLALFRAGYHVTMFSADGVPDRYRFLEGAESIISGSFPAKEFDCVVALDCSDHTRIKPIWEAVKNNFIINIDHHVTNRLFGAMNFVNADAAATGEIVFSLLTEMKIPLDAATATALHVAISTDTGSFKFESTTANTHQIAAQLLEAGANLREITPRVFDLRSRTAVCILREALNKLTFSDDGKIAWITLTEEEMQRCGARDEDLDGVVNYAKNIEEVELGLLFRQKTDGSVKVGFRSHNLDVGKLADSLGGGGHARAAGCSLTMTLEDALQTVVTAAAKEIRLWTEL